MPKETRLSIELNPDRIHAENIGEFHPEAIENATNVLRQLLSHDTESRAYRDAGILAACVVSVAVQTLATEPALDSEDQK